MTFTFDASLSTDLAKVRFHIGDTVDDGHYLEDATIGYYVTAYGVNTAVIRCIQFIITQLSKPDERVGQYSVSRASALAGYQALLKMKSQELGISVSGAVAASSVTLPYRPDSYMTTGAQDGLP